MKKKIGIIGGAGPMASSLFFQEIVRECQQKYGCSRDRDFPEIVLISYPFNPMLSVQDVAKNKAALVCQLQECFDRLSDQGMEIIVIACNTLHTIVDEIETDIPFFIRIDDVVAEYIQQKALNRIVLFSTETTAQLGLYCFYRRLEQGAQKVASSIIERVLAGVITDREIEDFCKIAQEIYADSPFDGIILGCTEFSQLYDELLKNLNQILPHVRLIDSTRLLARKAVAASFLQAFVDRDDKIT
jgi:aspartate racemase